MFGLKSKTLAAALCISGVVPINHAAVADVSYECKNSVCACSVFNNVEVLIYFRNKYPPFTHYNFKTNPGAQIELTNGYYHFRPGRNHSGTYSIQACSRGRGGFRSVCTYWAEFDWNAQRATSRNCLSEGRF
jgi:hypothetical protein